MDMDINIIILSFAFVIPIFGVVGSWAVMQYKLNDHAKLINKKADRETVQTQFAAINSALSEIQKNVRILIQFQKAK